MGLYTQHWKTQIPTQTLQLKRPCDSSHIPCSQSLVPSTVKWSTCITWSLIFLPPLKGHGPVSHIGSHICPKEAWSQRMLEITDGRKKASGRLKGWLSHARKETLLYTQVKRLPYKKTLCLELQFPGRQLKKFTACQCCRQTAKKEEEPIPKQEMQGRLSSTLVALSFIGKNTQSICYIIIIRTHYFLRCCWTPSKIILMQSEPRLGFFFFLSGFSEIRKLARYSHVSGLILRLLTFRQWPESCLPRESGEHLSVWKELKACRRELS